MTEAEIADLREQTARLSRHRDQCVAQGHPGCTFNPLLNQTWCACGEVVTPGDNATYGLPWEPA